MSTINDELRLVLDALPIGVVVRRGGVLVYVNDAVAAVTAEVAGHGMVWARSSFLGGQRHSAPGVPNLPHGHGFAASTSWKRAG